jgi:hypothetical protein
MAARRLVLILLVLLVVSTFAATLVPPPETDDERATSTTSTTAAEAREDRSRVVHETISADAKRPQRIRLVVGDELNLRITSRTFREVEIPGFGEYDEVDQYAPAIFDLLADEKGSYPVRVVAGGRLIGRIEVSGCCRTSRRSAGTSRSR